MYNLTTIENETRQDSLMKKNKANIAPNYNEIINANKQKKIPADYRKS